MIILVFCFIVLFILLLTVDFKTVWYRFIGKPLSKKQKVEAIIEAQCYWCKTEYMYKTKDVQRLLNHVWVDCPHCGEQDLVGVNYDKAVELERGNGEQP